VNSTVRSHSAGRVCFGAGVRPPPRKARSASLPASMSDFAATDLIPTWDLIKHNQQLLLSILNSFNLTIYPYNITIRGTLLQWTCILPYRAHILTRR
jgi:hypothetical protein